MFDGITFLCGVANALVVFWLVWPNMRMYFFSQLLDLFDKIPHWSARNKQRVVRLFARLIQLEPVEIVTRLLVETHHRRGAKHPSRWKYGWHEFFTGLVPHDLIPRLFAAVDLPKRVVNRSGRVHGNELIRFSTDDNGDGYVEVWLNRDADIDIWCVFSLRTVLDFYEFREGTISLGVLYARSYPWIYIEKWHLPTAMICETYLLAEGETPSEIRMAGIYNMEWV